MPSIYDFKVKDKADQDHDLAQYKGKVILSQYSKIHKLTFSLLGCACC
jgi:glutathione peroxidase-family protein